MLNKIICQLTLLMLARKKLDKCPFRCLVSFFFLANKYFISFCSSTITETYIEKQITQLIASFERKDRKWYKNSLSFIKKNIEQKTKIQ